MQVTNQPGIGEPIRLKGKNICFTSWKFVNQGSFKWTVDEECETGSNWNFQSLWGWDGDTPATFTSHVPHGIELRARKATKISSSGIPDCWCCNIIQDAGLLKLWYGISESEEDEPYSSKQTGKLVGCGHNWHICYAESRDGFNWEFPSFDHVPYKGPHPHSNLVFRADLNGSQRGIHGPGVFIDPASEEERFKMIYAGWLTQEEWDRFLEKHPDDCDPCLTHNRMGICGAVSPDGIHWEVLEEPLMLQFADTMNNCYYDLDRKKYILYTRHWSGNWQAEGMAEQFGGRFSSTCRRSIARAYSNDFRYFGQREIIACTSADMKPGHLWYTNGKTTLPGCPDQHVMFPWRWELESDGGDTFLMSSPFGNTWSVVPGSPVLTRDEPGTNTGGYVMGLTHLVELAGDKWAIPYRGCPIPHKYPGRDDVRRNGLFPDARHEIGYATWPKGRLVGLECPDEGAFSLVGMMPPGCRINLNASVPADGYIKVAVANMGDDIEGRGFDDCDRILGDGFDLPVSWKGEQGIKHNDKPIVVSFRMRKATLYGVEFK